MIDMNLILLKGMNQFFSCVTVVSTLQGGLYEAAPRSTHKHRLFSKSRAASTRTLACHQAPEKVSAFLIVLKDLRVQHVYIFFHNKNKKSSQDKTK